MHGQRFISAAEPLVWAMARYMVKALFLAGHETVILDATNTTKKRRAEWMCDGDFGWWVKYQPISTSEAECLSRAAAMNDAEIVPIIKKMAAFFQPLTEAETDPKYGGFMPEPVSPSEPPGAPPSGAKPMTPEHELNAWRELTPPHRLLSILEPQCVDAVRNGRTFRAVAWVDVIDATESTWVKAADVEALRAASLPTTPDLTALVEKWRKERNDLNAAAAGNSNLFSQAAWCGQALGRSDCANELEAALRAASLPTPELQESSTLQDIQREFNVNAAEALNIQRLRVEDRKLIELAFGFHVGIEGEYGCPGIICPGVQRLVKKMRELKGVGRFDYEKQTAPPEDQP